MPDVYVEVCAMAYSTDTKKVATKYAVKVQKLMREAAVQAIRIASGFTPDKKGDPTGFHFDATLSEIAFGTYQGQPSVTCKVNGSIETYPRKELVTKTLTGSATVVGGTSDRDVEDCIGEVMKATVKDRVIPLLKQKSKP